MNTGWVVVVGTRHRVLVSRVFASKKDAEPFQSMAREIFGDEHEGDCVFYSAVQTDTLQAKVQSLQNQERAEQKNVRRELKRRYDALNFYNSDSE